MATANPSLWEKQLSGLLKQRVKVFLSSGRAYTGDLLAFDDDTLIIGPEGPACPGGESTVAREQVSSFRRA